MLCYCSHCIGTRLNEHVYHVISLLYAIDYPVIQMFSKSSHTHTGCKYTFNLTTYEGNQKSRPPNLQTRNPWTLMFFASGQWYGNWNTTQMLNHINFETNALADPKWHWTQQGQRYTIYVLRVSLSHKFIPCRSTTNSFRVTGQFVTRTLNDSKMTLNTTRSDQGTPYMCN